MDGNHSLTIDGVNLVYRLVNPNTAGNTAEEPLILIHGLGHGIHLWDIESTFHRFGPCYALGLPGHPPAERMAPETLDTERLPRIMAEAIRQMVGERPVTLIGHSTGGWVALAIAARYPEMVTRIVSVSAFETGHLIGFYGLNQRLVRAGLLGKLCFWAMAATILPTPFLVHRVWGTAIAKPYVLKTPFYRELSTYMMPSIQSLSIRVLTAYYGRLPELDLKALLPQIKVPVLVIVGDSDPIVPADNSHKIAAKLAHGHLEVLPGCGHLPFLEQPEAFRAIVARWMQKHPLSLTLPKTSEAVPTSSVN